MVLLTVTAAAKAAINEFCRLKEESNDAVGDEITTKTNELSEIRLGSPIDHSDLIKISQFLVQESRQRDEETAAKVWRLDALLRGADVYQPPPPPKPEPTPEYKELMKRLRAEEEQRQYERMINPLPLKETFKQRFPGVERSFDPTPSLSQSMAERDEADEVTYADVDRQLTLIINVLVSIIACGVAIWFAARRWEVPQRLALSMSGSLLVAVAEVAIYMGYINRIKDAKGKEKKKVERKEIVETWVLEPSTNSSKSLDSENVRYRKGKHR